MIYKKPFIIQTMAKNDNPFSYRRIRVDPKNEVSMVGVLMESGKHFSAISKTDYLISNEQCNQLTENNIPYQKL